MYWFSVFAEEYCPLLLPRSRVYGSSLAFDAGTLGFAWLTAHGCMFGTTGTELWLRNIHNQIHYLSVIRISSPRVPEIEQI